jgi:hypothetical protein
MLYQGRDSGRAGMNGKKLGLQPLPGRIGPEMLVRRELSAGKKPRG